MLEGFGLKAGQHGEYRRVGIEPDDFLNELAHLSDGDGVNRTNGRGVLCVQEEVDRRVRGLP
jgi:hypothetical protein